MIDASQRDSNDVVVTSTTDTVTLTVKKLEPEVATAIILILQEFRNATKKHPVWPKCNIKRAALVAEEAGELIREANQLDEDKGSLLHLKMEAIQTASTALRMVTVLGEGGGNV